MVELGYNYTSSNHIKSSGNASRASRYPISTVCKGDYAVTDYTPTSNQIQEIPYGYCQCGCGQLAPIANRNDTRGGKVKGQPMRYLPNHHVRDGSLPVAPEGYKTCTKCCEVKPATAEYFQRDKKTQDGLKSQCKLCRKEYGEKHYLANAERISEKTKQYYQVHAERKRRRSREYHLANKERLLKQRRNYRIANVDKIREQQARYRAANREVLATRVAEYKRTHKEQYRTYSLRRIAQKRKAEGFHTADDVARQYAAQKGRCYYCKAKVGDTYHVDHVIPLVRGGSDGPENIVVACVTCNTSKKQRMPHEWPQGGRLL